VCYGRKKVIVPTPEQLPQDASRIIIPTEGELKTSQYNTKNSESALGALRQDGLVVLKSIVDIGHVDNLDKFMNKKANELVRTCKCQVIQSRRQLHVCSFESLILTC